MLKQLFTELVSNYSADNKLSVRLWNEIEINYLDAGRYYHDLSHIRKMYNELLPVKDLIEDWDAILFALFYHDIVYQTKRMDNESESALLAEKRLKEIQHFPIDRINRCSVHILATKGHNKSFDNDTNLFTDADLSILGAENHIYKQYIKDIRREYFIYSDKEYAYGRRMALLYFLKMKQIFKTTHFLFKYEEQARRNIQEELDILAESTRTQ